MPLRPRDKAEAEMGRLFSRFQTMDRHHAAEIEKHHHLCSKLDINEDG